MTGALWLGLAVLVAGAGIARLLRMRDVRRGADPTVDDDSIRRILEEGSLDAGDDEPLDLDEAARAEEEFWNEEWDEPDEYHP